MKDMRYEADIIKLLAALSAAPRWMTALVVADGAQFVWGDTELWRVVSAVLSVLFAGVETYAAAYMMREWRQTPAGSAGERKLFCLWLATLLLLVGVMTPPVYANTSGREFRSLPAWLMLSWSICVSASTFLVVGGVGYAEKATQARTGADQRNALGGDVNPDFICRTCGAQFTNRFALSGHHGRHSKKRKTSSPSVGTLGDQLR